MTRFPECAFLVALDRRLKVLRSVVRAEALLGEDYSRHPAGQDKVTEAPSVTGHLPIGRASLAASSLPSIGCILGMENVGLLPRSKFFKMWERGEQKFQLTSIAF